MLRKSSDAQEVLRSGPPRPPTDGSILSSDKDYFYGTDIDWLSPEEAVEVANGMHMHTLQ